MAEYTATERNIGGVLSRLYRLITLSNHFPENEIVYDINVTGDDSPEIINIDDVNLRRHIKDKNIDYSDTAKVTINAAGGNDRIGVDIADKIFIDSGAGDDKVRLGYFSVKEGEVNLGSGNDRLNMVYAKSNISGIAGGVFAGGVFKIDGGDGVDTVDIGNKENYVSRIPNAKMQGVNAILTSTKRVGSDLITTLRFNTDSTPIELRGIEKINIGGTTYTPDDNAPTGLRAIGKATPYIK